MKSATTSLRRVLLSPLFSEFFSYNGPVDMMEEDVISSLSVRVKINITVWDFILPETPSLPAVFGVSFMLIKVILFASSEYFFALLYLKVKGNMNSLLPDSTDM